MCSPRPDGRTCSQPQSRSQRCLCSASCEHRGLRVSGLPFQRVQGQHQACRHHLSLPLNPISRPQRPAMSLLPYVQLNRRIPDVERHVETQTRPCAADAALWVCCGVPLIDVREEHEVPGQVLVAEPLLHEGMFMVGGCRKVYSRRDALRGICARMKASALRIVYPRRTMNAAY
ncbi:hypothetical protein PYCCODRAFT_76040 [Trametes coccinea BRFM310]|uniref:Uncharacterized protein n=1 Tax=Trametes coccinea (strain BRFM310) TaxID=1353009 RepID=A0A1Y2IVZ6_TRAC3|nr:hypothetical protein PYCCODRAFT_76040 [Trametes coccinea BRFM310]